MAYLTDLIEPRVLQAVKRNVNICNNTIIMFIQKLRFYGLTTYVLFHWLNLLEKSWFTATQILFLLTRNQLKYWNRNILKLYSLCVAYKTYRLTKNWKNRHVLSIPHRHVLGSVPKIK